MTNAHVVFLVVIVVLAPSFVIQSLSFVFFGMSDCFSIVCVSLVFRLVIAACRVGAVVFHAMRSRMQAVLAELELRSDRGQADPLQHSSLLA